MNDLGTALRELAGEATPAPADPAALWSQGRARVRRRRLAGVALVAAAAAVVAAGTLTVASPTAVVPAGTRHAPAVPENVWPAKSWYAGTDRTGPPGVVAVVGGLGRDGGNGLFAVSGTTGAYRLLDLPGLADLSGNEAATPAPDGRHIAYWLTGKTSGTPAVSANSEDLPVGIGVYDTRTGDVERFLPPTEHGISADTLQWVDNDNLLITFGQRTSGSSSDRITSYAWKPGSGKEPTVVAGDPALVFDPIRNRDGGLLAPVREAAVGRNLSYPVPRYGELLPSGKASAASAVAIPPASGASYTTVARSEDYVVAEVHLDNGNDEVRVGRIESGGTVPRMTALTTPDFIKVKGWLDADRILVLGTPTQGDTNASLYAIDLRTLDSTRLGTADGNLWSPGLIFATDLLAEPMVHGDRPPRVDPRWWAAGLAAGAVVLLGAVGSRLRRRRRGGY